MKIEFNLEDIDGYVNSLMQGCKLAKTITITDIKKRNTINAQNEKSEDTIEGKLKKPVNINQILNKIKENANDMSASEDSVSLFNEKQNRQKREKEKETCKETKVNDVLSRTKVKEPSRKVILGQGEDSFVTMINSKFKSKISEYHEMKLAKEN